MTEKGGKATGAGKRPAEAKTDDAAAATGGAAGATFEPGVRVDDRQMKSSYCNVCNVSSTREEVVLNFGMNHNWDRGGDLQIDLHHRVVMSPQAAVRLHRMIGDMLGQYRARYGPLDPVDGE